VVTLVDRVSTRERILRSAAELLRRQGYAATGLKQVVAEADAPFGSLYHHFPGGKEQLGGEVLRTGGAFFLLLFEQIAEGAPDVVTGVRDFFAGAADTLKATDFADACPIATVAGETASTNETLRRVAADVFASWVAAGAVRFEQAGIPRVRARELALAVFALIEGGFLLSRAQRSTEPMTASGLAAVALVRAALEST
jgi:AcrR family transcriptional regulator